MIYRFILFVSFFCMFCGCSDSRSECDKVSGYFLSQLAKQMRKKELFAIGSGGGCTIDQKINLIEMTFIYKNILNIETARRLMVISSDSLLELINSSSKNKNFFETIPVPIEVIHISIIGETPIANIPDKIWGAQLIKGKIYYNIDNPSPPPQKDGPLLTVHEETFEEAKKILSQQAEAI